MSDNVDDSLYGSRSTHLKNQYSTFIEELEQTTEKLIDQVFNTPYQPQIQLQSTKRKKSNKQYFINKNNNTKGQKYAYRNHGNFSSFLIRNQKWYENRQKNIHKEAEKKQQQLQNLTFTPQIIRGSKEKLEPLYSRCLDIQHRKEQDLAFKRIDQKRQEEQQIKKISFHPKVLKKGEKPRSLKQYLQDKEQWMKKKQQKVQRLKLLSQARKYEQCLFQPILATDYYNIRHSRQGKVQQRLLQSLQKSVQKIKRYI